MLSFKNVFDEKLYVAFCKLSSDDEFKEAFEFYVDESNVVDPHLMIEQFFTHELTNFFDYNNLYFQYYIAQDLYLTYKVSLNAILDFDVNDHYTFDKEAIFEVVEKYSPSLDISHEVLKLMKAIEKYQPTLDEAYLDNLLNIDLPDLETVIRQLD